MPSLYQLHINMFGGSLVWTTVISYGLLLVLDVSGTATSSQSKAASACPSLPSLADINDNLCWLQYRMSNFGCSSDNDCSFLPNHICCEYYCGTKKCINPNAPPSPVSGPSGSGSVKNRQNVPTLEQLVAAYLERQHEGSQP